MPSSVVPPSSIAVSPDGTELFFTTNYGLSELPVFSYYITTAPMAGPVSQSINCVPTSLTVKGNYLFVVTNSTCPSLGVTGLGTTDPVNVYDITNTTFVTSFTATALTSGGSGPADSSAVPLVVASSIDPTDTYVYVGSTDGYISSCGGTCKGYLSTIDTSTSPPSIVNSQELFGAGYAIAPLGMVVTSAYPSGASGPTHTVAIVGPGYDTAVGPAGMYLFSYPQQCAVVCPTSSQLLIYAETGPGTYVPIPTAASPDGLTVYAGDGGNFVDRATSSDGGETFNALGGYFSTGGSSNCNPPSCQPINSLAITADGSQVFGGFSTQISSLGPQNLSSINTTTVGQYPLGLAVSQAPEIQTAIVNQSGTNFQTSVTFHGNFQNQYNGVPGYGVNFTDPSGASTSPTLPMWPSTSTSSFTASNMSYAGSTATAGAASISVGVFPSVGSVGNPIPAQGATFITAVPVAPLVVSIPALPSNIVPVSDSSSAPFQIGANVTGPSNPDTVNWTIVSGTGSFTPPDSASNAATTYIAPTTAMLNANPTQVVVQANSDTIGCSQGVGNICSAPYTLTVMAPTATAPNPPAFLAQPINTESQPETITLTNSSQTIPLTITSTGSLSGANPTDFKITQGPNMCTVGTGTLAPGVSCTISVAFDPQAGLSTSRSASLQISDNAFGGPQTVLLSGTAQQPPQVSLTFSGSPVTSLSFGSIAQGVTSAAQQVTLTNTGGATLAISGIAIAASTPSVGNSGDFKQTNTCPASLAGGANCIITLTFAPSIAPTTTAQPESATLNITDNATSSPQTISLSGTESAQTSPPVVTWTPSPPSLPFGNQVENTTSKSQQVVLQNTGGTALAISSIAMGGANPGDFAQTNNCPTSVASGANCTFNVTFTPTTTGQRGATINIADNATGSPQSISLSGAGTQFTVSISPATAPPVVTGGTLQFSATVQGNTNQAVTWSVSGAGCSGGPCGTISASGLYTAPSLLPTIQPVIDNVIATAQGTSVQSTPVPVTVSLANPVSVLVAPATATVTLGTNAQFSASVGSVTNQSVTWQVNGIMGGNSTFGTVSPSGLYAAPAVMPASATTVDVSATSVADPTKSNSAIVTLLNPVSVTLSPSSGDVQAGATLNFTAAVLPSGSNPNVTWSVSGAGCSGTSCGTFTYPVASSTATVTFTASPTLASASAVQVTATSVEQPMQSASALVNLYLAPSISTASGTTLSETVSAGQSATYTLDLAPGSGDPTKPLTVQCDPRYVPTGVTCPSQSIQPGSSAVSFTLTLSTTGPSSTAQASPSSRSIFATSLGLIFPFWIVLAVRRGRKSKSGWLGMFLLGALLLPASVITFAGCGTSGSFGQASPKDFNATPSGTYSIPLVGTGPGGQIDPIGQITLIVK